MFLSEINEVMRGRVRLGRIDGIKITGLCSDSRRVKEGDLFFCKGRGFKEEYIAEAIEKGAAAFVCDEKNAVISGESAVIEVDEVTVAMAEAARYYYGDPMKKIVTVAVTGTKGKTTVSGYICGIINRQRGMRCAVLNELLPSDAPRLTTPEAIDFQGAAARAADEGYTHLVCEISSQAVKTGRIYGMEFDIGCFTGFGRDHIGKNEHKDENEYFFCKSAIISVCRKKVINVSEAWGKKLFESFTDGSAVSVCPNGHYTDYYAKNVQTAGYGCDLNVVNGKTGKQIEVMTEGFGAFNAVNALCAAAVAMECGIEGDAIFLGILDSRPGGRGEMIGSADGKVTLVVDYAHNEMSFEAMLGMAKTHFAGATVSVIFGCPGDKAECRRRQLAEVSVRLADKITVCEDDSGEEGFESIKRELYIHFNDVCRELGKESKLALISYVESRSEALRRVLESAKESEGKSVIFMLGKGNETLNRGYGCDQSCISDIALAREAIRKYDECIALTKELIVGSESKGRRLLVCVTEGERVARELAPSLSAVIRSGNEVFTVCDENDLPSIEAACFSEGVAVYGLGDGRASLTDLKTALGTARAGVMPLIVTKNRKNCVLRLTGAMKFDDVVYIGYGRGIIFNESILAETMSLRRARLLNKYLPENSVYGALGCFDRGASRVAVIDGGRRGALVSFLIGGSCGGTVVTKKEA